MIGASVASFLTVKGWKVAAKSLTTSTFLVGDGVAGAATELDAFVKAHPGRVHVLKVVSADKENNKAAVDEVKRVAGRLDVVIANAGIHKCYAPALEVTPEEMIRHFEVRGALSVASNTIRVMPLDGHSPRPSRSTPTAPLSCFRRRTRC